MCRIDPLVETQYVPNEGVRPLETETEPPNFAASELNERHVDLLLSGDYSWSYNYGIKTVGIAEPAYDLNALIEDYNIVSPDRIKSEGNAAKVNYDLDALIMSYNTVSSKVSQETKPEVKVTGAAPDLNALMAVYNAAMSGQQNVAPKPDQPSTDRKQYEFFKAPNSIQGEEDDIAQTPTGPK